jgi:hypothetical protein
MRGATSPLIQKRNGEIMMSATKYPEQFIEVNGESIPYHQVDHDVNGNPRFVVHFLSLDIELADYGRIPGLKKYRAKWFGGGYVFQSYNLEQDLQWAFKQVKAYYN